MRKLILTIMFIAALAVVIAPLGGWGEEKVSKASVVEKKEPAEAPPASPSPPSIASTTADAASEWAAVRRSLAKTKISLAGAVKIAQDKVAPGKLDAGRVVEAYFKVNDSRPLYAVEIILNGDQHQEVVIDAISGKVVELGAPDPEDKSEQEIEAAVAKFKITIPEAIEAASQNMPHARPFDAHAERADDAIVLTVELLDGAEVRSVRIDPSNGAVLSAGPQKQ
jgi:uncharacterized membrane protein YkoI